MFVARATCVRRAVLSCLECARMRVVRVCVTVLVHYIFIHIPIYAYSKINFKKPIADMWRTTIRIGLREYHASNRRRFVVSFVAN